MHKLEAMCVFFSCYRVFRLWHILSGFDHLGVGVYTYDIGLIPE